MTIAVHVLDRNLPKFSVDQIKVIAADLYGIQGDFKQQKVQRAGGLVIADEVQSGLGHMGQFWGFMAVRLERVDMVTTFVPVYASSPSVSR